MPYKVRVPDMRYGGRTYQKGEPIEPNPKHAKVLRAVGKIEEGAPEAKPLRRADTPRPPRRSPEGAAAASGRYLRSDLRAED